MNAVRRLAIYVKPYWQWVLLAPLLMLGEVTMDLMQPRLLATIVDEGIARLDMGVVVRTAALMVGLAILGAGGGISNGIFASKAAQSFGADLRQDLFSKVEQLSFANIDRLQTGQLVTRLTSDVVQVQEALYTLLRIMVRAPLLLVGGLIMAIITAPQLAFLPLGLMPLTLIPVIWVVRKATPLFGRVQRRLDALNEIMQENLAGIRVVKAFARSEHERLRFGTGNRELAEETIRTIRVIIVVMPVMMFTVNLGVVGVLWFGGVNVVEGSMQVGQLMAFVNYLAQILMSVLMVSMLVTHLARATASAERIQEILDSIPTIRDKPDAISDPPEDATVAFEDVTFAYDGDGADAALQGISFVARPGQTLAMLGQTGSGKSTLVHLIPRYYDVTGGRITVGGVDVRDMSSATLRRMIGAVLQETVLFSGTIRDNIRYGRPDASQEEVEQAARMAQAHDFIQEFPDGYDTILGQRGVNLSGGQKQRVAIARALLVEPPILILDDSTSSVDVETEAMIQQALEAYGRDRTCIMVAQRISSVLNADQILVLNDGRVVASGTHEQLVASSPVYREIYESQLGNAEVLDV
jgi:ATP-binding cassette, subfamily B, multidrug efflux pump